MQRKCFYCANLLVATVIVMACLVLIGWQFNISVFKTPAPDMVAMNPATALLFILSGIAFFLLLKKDSTPKNIRAGNITCFVIILVASLRMVDIFFTTGVSLDHILFEGWLKNNSAARASNYIAPNTALCFLLMGISLLLLHYETPGKKMPADYTALAMVFLGLFSILGYLYSVPSFYSLRLYMPMAIYSAVCFLCLATAILFADPAKGIAAMLAGNLIGSNVARLLVPVAVIVPVILGLISLYAHWANLFSVEFGLAVLVISIIVAFLSMIWYNSLLLNKRDRQRIKVEQQVMMFNEQLENQVKEKTAELIGIFERITDGFIALDKNYNYIYANQKTGELLGRNAHSLIGKNIWKEFPEVVDSGTYHSFYQAMQQQRNMVIVDYYQPLGFWYESYIYPSPEGLSVFIKDITAQKKNEEDLRLLQVEISTQKIQEQKKIARAIIKAQEEEKNHLGKELHDNIGQILASAKIFLSIAAKKDEKIKEALQQPIALINNSIDELRALSHKKVCNLKNVDLEKLGRALMLTLENAQVSSTCFNCQLNNDQVSDELKLNIYRILQIQVNNVIKHADANAVSVNIVQKDGNVEIVTLDDGRGFDQAVKRKGIGILNMINRIESFNGRAEISSKPGCGCRIKVTIPIQ